MEKNINKIVLIIFAIVLISTVVLVSIYFNRQKKSLNDLVINTPSPVTIKEKVLTGVVKMGSEVPSKESYCLTEAYLVTETDAIQIRVPDDSKLSPNEYFDQYKNQKVEVKGKTNELTGGCIETQKDCTCDAFVLVTDIKLQ